MSLQLFVGLEIPMWKWLTRNKLASLIGPNHLTDTWNSWSHMNTKTNTMWCVTNIKMPHWCNRLMFNMLQFGVGGLPLGLPMRLPMRVQSMNSISGWNFGPSIQIMGRFHVMCNFFPHEVWISLCIIHLTCNLLILFHMFVEVFNWRACGHVDL